MATENKTDFAIKRGFTDGKLRQLNITENALSFEDGYFSGSGPTIFRKEDVAEFRYGIRWIRFELTYGREYQIFVRSKQGKVVKITFKSYFRRRIGKLHSQYVAILSALDSCYFDGIRDEFIRKVNAGETVQIGDVSINSENISFPVSGIASQKRIEVPWKNLGIKLYYRYFSIYDTTDAKSKNRGYNFHEDWNASVLHDVIKMLSINAK